jgi:hypothetical protein
MPGSAQISIGNSADSNPHLGLWDVPCENGPHTSYAGGWCAHNSDNEIPPFHDNHRGNYK